MTLSPFRDGTFIESVCVKTCAAATRLGSIFYFTPGLLAPQHAQKRRVSGTPQSARGYHQFRPFGAGSLRVRSTAATKTEFSQRLSRAGLRLCRLSGCQKRRLAPGGANRRTNPPSKQDRAWMGVPDPSERARCRGGKHSYARAYKVRRRNHRRPALAHSITASSSDFRIASDYP